MFSTSAKPAPTAKPDDRGVDQEADAAPRDQHDDEYTALSVSSVSGPDVAAEGGARQAGSAPAARTWSASATSAAAAPGGDRQRPRRGAAPA